MSETQTATAVVGKAGGTGILVADLDLLEAGSVEVTVNWNITVPGTGPNGGSRPPLVASLTNPRRQGVGLVTQAAGQPPLHFVAPVDTGPYVVGVGQYEIDVCGACTIECTMSVTHPPGVLRARPAPNCREWIVEPVNIQGNPRLVYPEIDLGSSPATARLRVGQSSRIRVVGLECSGYPGFEPLQWSADPDIAAVTYLRLGEAELRAVGRGETRLQAALVSQDGTSATAEFSYCSSRDPTGVSCVSATPLVLVVVR